MASPIESTPTLHGDDARRLIESLDNRCSPEEAKRRQAAAKAYLQDMKIRRQIRDLPEHGVSRAEYKAILELIQALMLESDPDDSDLDEFEHFTSLKRHTVNLLALLELAIDKTIAATSD